MARGERRERRQKGWHDAKAACPFWGERHEKAVAKFHTVPGLIGPLSPDQVVYFSPMIDEHGRTEQLETQT